MSVGSLLIGLLVSGMKKLRNYIVMNIVTKH